MADIFFNQINIWCRFACSLLRQGMKQIIINLETPEIKAFEKAGEKGSIAEVNACSVNFLFN